MGSPRQRQAREREAAYDRIERQQREGTLVVRQMTAAEREYWGPAQPVRRRRKRVVRESEPSEE